MNEHTNVSRPPAGRGGFGWACLILTLLVLGPLVVYGLSGESDRWRAATLFERYLDGDRQAAIDGMREIVQRQPDNLQLRATLVRWLLDNNQAVEALRLIRQVPGKSRNVAVEELSMECLAANNQWQEAFQLFRQLNPAARQRNPSELLSHLNRLAYWQMLSDEALIDAERNSHRAVAEMANEWQATVGDESGPTLQVALASVLVYRGAGGKAAAARTITSREYRQEIMAILDPVIEQLSAVCASGQSASEGNTASEGSTLWQWLRGSGPGLQQLIGGNSEENRQTLAINLASMLTARALVFQDLGEMEKSFADRRRVAELGHDPEEIARHWPDLSSCLPHLMALASFLDTRGCVQYKLGRDALAQADLNAAVMAQETLCRAGTRIAATWLFETADLREQRVVVEQQWDRTLAVILFHRSWVNQGLNRVEDAAADLRRVRELGFEPGPGLF
jgi:hypothetical protein